MQKRLLTGIGIAAVCIPLVAMGFRWLRPKEQPHAAQRTTRIGELPGIPAAIRLNAAARPVVYEEAQIPKFLSVTDKSLILELLGRVPGIKYELLSASACWEDIPVVVRLRVPEAFIFLVKDQSGDWTLGPVLWVRSGTTGIQRTNMSETEPPL